MQSWKTLGGTPQKLAMWDMGMSVLPGFDFDRKSPEPGNGSGAM